MTTNDEYVVAALDRMIELLEQGWCQGTMARDADGVRTHASDDEASSWCLRGAVSRATYELLLGYDGRPMSQRQTFVFGVDGVYPRVHRLLDEVAAPLDPVSFNDDPSTSREDVLLLVKRAREAVTS